MNNRATLFVGGAALAVLFSTTAMAAQATDGEVKLAFSQAPSIMNPYLSGGTKDLVASSMVLEPLIRFNPQGEMVPWLVTEIPTVANGGISEDLRSVTYHLTPDVKWSDGTDFTADDVVFTAKYCMDPDGGCAQLSHFEGVEKVEAVDPLTVKVTFDTPKPYPYSVFATYESPILEEKQFANCTGAAAPTCADQNFQPNGTGPFIVTEFRPNDTITLKANPNYRDPDKPHFANVMLKGGGDAASAARSVLQTGEFDYAWNTQLAPDVLANMIKGGKGTSEVAFGSLVERLQMNQTDASPSLPADERSTTAHPNPVTGDLAVRKALSMAIDRNILAQIGYGKAGVATCNWVPAPEAYVKPDNDWCLTQDIEGAKKVLEDDGWVDSNGDGVREKDGVKLSILFQTSTNGVRQDFQSIIKEWWSEIGVETELRNVDGSVFFGGDPNSPDTFQKFYADVEMYANNFPGIDPAQYVAQYTCDKIPRPATGWQGENINRYCNADYDALVKELGQTAGIEARGKIVQQLNAMLTKDSMVLQPLVYRGTQSAKSNTLGGVEINGWDSELWNIADWYRVQN
ncbi:peptide ABC transporter substrate-binding protein [Martelella alba]|uniref:Peptide ABC transporter substrate-binding protein n=1 Tax=Martelella alba TaxID=2590451 RepID=A0A506UAU3_9HYPH|nr:peptide ABC transporter substrate-binding protein [Martelella alba]TPW31532.1 peptide ABC transporter substrate-binding protein [Martelella alba]